MHTEQTEPAGLRELLSTVFIYRWTIVGLTVLFGMGAVAVSLVQAPAYEASVQMWAQDQSPGLRGTSNYAADSAARVRLVLSNLREVIYSRQVLEATLGAVGLDAAWRSGEAAGLSREQVIEQEVGRFAKAIRLDAPKGSDFGATQIFFLRVRDRDPARAAALLDTLLVQFRKRYEELSAEQAQHLFEETTVQLNKSRESLTAAAESFDQFVRELEGGMPELNSLGGSPNDSELRRGITLVNERLVPAEADVKTQEALLEQLERSVQSSPDVLVVPGTFVRDYPALELAARELSSTRLLMDSVAARTTPQNPEFQAMYERLRLAENTYRQAIDKSIEAVRRDLTAKSEAIAFLRSQKEGYAKRLAELTDRFVEFDGLKQELAQRRAIVADAERRQSEAAHARVTAAQETLFATLDGPRTGSKPVSPNPPLNVAIGTLLGFVTGIGLALLARHYSQIVRSEPDLAGLAHGLLVVSVPKVRNPLRKVG